MYMANVGNTKLYLYKRTCMYRDVCVCSPLSRGKNKESITFDLHDISVFNPCIYESNVTYYLGSIVAQPHLLINANPGKLLSVLAISGEIPGTIP